MRPAFTVVAQHVSHISPALLPITLLAAGTLCALATPLRHSLFVTGIAWLLAAANFGWKARRSGVGSGGDGSRSWKLSVFAGLLYALAQICERAGADRENFWWTRSLFPLFTYSLLRTGLENELGWKAYNDSSTNSEKGNPSPPKRLVLVATGTAAAALGTVWVSPLATTLGVTSSLLTAASLLLVEEVIRISKHAGPIVNSIDGLLQPRSRSPPRDGQLAWAALRDMTFVVGTVCLATSLSSERFRNDGMTYRPNWLWEKWGTQWKTIQPRWNIERDIFGVIIELAYALLLLNFTRKEGTLQAAFLSLGSILLAKLATGFALTGVWLTALYACTTLLAFDDSASISLLSSSRKRTRAKQVATALAAATLALMSFNAFRHSRAATSRPTDLSFLSDSPIEALDPLRMADTSSHPVAQLIKQAEARSNVILNRQSKTLQEAAAEYRRRYGIPPPPKFDVWFEFAKRKNVLLVDEFDTIHHSLLPFWALEPSVIRGRVSEALGYSGNFLIAVLIREGQIVKFEGGQEWQQKAVMGMMRDFVHYLPDMDLAFNIHDEPRVILPNDLLSKLVTVAVEHTMPAAFRQKEPKNMFSARPADMSDGRRIQEAKATRFNKFAHQQAWAQSRLSCSPDSPARDYKELAKDNATAYAITDLGFVYNQTAFSDICISPSLSKTFGFFDRPNAFNVVQDLFPIFSQSKISSFQDILYPSPWYWANRVEYNAEKDMDWQEKETKLYWRGSTTGGFSRHGGWRRQHRQRVVRRLNEPGDAKILTNKAQGQDDSSHQSHQQEGKEKEKQDWQPVDVPRKDFEQVIDVKFSHVGQCDPSDCDAQKEFFEVVDRVDQQDAWKYKHLLDMDGNAFSGRFYAFLKSKSLVHKMSIFQEWHKDWLSPWLHYIPMSLRGDEWLEAVRYFTHEGEGKELAPHLAMRSREWADNALRNEDLEVWFFRLLLEYGRLIDDNRETIGYPA